MGFLDIFTKADKPVAGASTIGRYTAGGISSGGWINDYSSNGWDLGRNISKGYERVVWVFKCVDAIASAQASVTVYLKDFSTAHGEVVNDKDFNFLLNRKANPYENSWKFRYRLSAQLLLSPLGAFIEVVKTPAGVIKELYL